MLFRLLFIIICFLFGNGCTFSNGVFNIVQITSQHYRIAILPIAGNLCTSQKEYLKKEFRATLSEEESYEYQQFAYKYQANYKAKMTITVQPTDSTNLLLKQKKLFFSTRKGEAIHELCNILNVDAVLYIQMSSTTFYSSGARTNFVRNTYATISSKAVLYTTDQAIWKCEGRISGGANCHNEGSIRALLRKTIKNLPYRKQ